MLNSTLDCTGIECEVDTPRSVEVTDGIFYEYIRLPCAARAYFNGAKVLAKHKNGGMLICGDPGTEVASVACCGDGGRVWTETVRKIYRFLWARGLTHTLHWLSCMSFPTSDPLRFVQIKVLWRTHSFLYRVGSL